MYSSKRNIDIKLDHIQIIEYYNYSGLYAYELVADEGYVLFNIQDEDLFEYDFINGKKIVKKNFYYYNKVFLTVNHKINLVNNNWIAVRKDTVPEKNLIEIEVN